MRSVGWAPLILAAACGSIDPGPADPIRRVDYGEGSVFSGSPAKVSYDERRLGPARQVVAGIVATGTFQFDERTQTYVKPSCLDPKNNIIRTSVKTYRLMEREVTNAGYRECQASGDCPPVPVPHDTGYADPGQGDHPVIVTFAGAHTFCRRLGGEVPTVFQFARAMQADTEGYAFPAVVDLARMCWNPSERQRPECKSFRDELRKRRPVGTLWWDRGPFGHTGLAAYGGEWVRAGNQVAKTGDGCSVPFPEVERVSAASPEGQGFVSVQSVLQARTELAPFMSGGVVEQSETSPFLPATAFRCAFPSQP